MKKSASTNKRPKRGVGAGGAGKGEAQSPGEEKTGGEPISQAPHHPSRNAHGRTIHNGSAGAFDATEHSHDEEDEDQDSDDFALGR